MRPPYDAHPEMTEADRTSQTRFGPRPVPKAHKTASPYAHRKMVSSRIPPSGKVSPDGKQSWPEPSTTAKVVVWGGVALGVAGIAAAISMAVQSLSGDDDAPAPRRRADGARSNGPRPAAPRFAEMDEDDREAMRRRVRAQALEDNHRSAQARSKAGRGKANVAKDLTRTATDLSQGLNGVAQSLLAAFQSFRGVSHQATGIVGEFVAAADQLRAIMNGGAGPRPGATDTDPARPLRDEPPRR
ncbi:hypothetical protein FA743_10555 [Paracoccus gahaiensis]|uniref:Uncharacterized protein n=1 Tax=Paracoccus gahaiensis TaxID=1706839 RepID=A0A4U0R990_9RHOB|nr:hypothetical protein [Paracoccus gahaiensis]TJZ91537.1 hypothetical protein FA743_10555 [Paracoccus gahaiensis]